jgi:hypothetical protein
MADVLDILKKIGLIEIVDQASSAVEKTQEIASDLITGQLSIGIKSDGTELPDYSAASVDIFGKEPGPIKLFDTGDFYRGVKVIADGSGIVYTSSDTKADDLEKRYSTRSGSILKLTEESKQEYYKDLQPVFVDNVKKILTK